jgi:hypothetical protein
MLKLVREVDRLSYLGAPSSSLVLLARNDSENRSITRTQMVRGTLPVVALSAALFLTASIAQAQVMVNDPAEGLVQNGHSRFSPVQAQELELDQDELAKVVKADKDKKDAKAQAEALPLDLKPEKDVTDTADDTNAAPPADDNIKAKAVLVDINSETLNYDKDRDVYIATGAVHMVISEQNSELYADRLIYDQNQDLVIAEGSVTIVQNGQKTHGSYAKIDLTRKSALINDYAATVQQVRILAKHSFVNQKYVQYENGRIVLSPSVLQSAFNNKQSGAKGADKIQAHAERDIYRDDEDIEHLGDSALEKTELTDDSGQNATVFGNPDAKSSNFSYKMKQIDIYRDANGYNRVIGRWPSVSYKGHKLFTMPSTEMSYDEPSQTMEYLGPDIGYDPDYGGFYGGPGWDFRAGEHGSIRVSPLISMGGGGRRIRGGSTYERVSNGPGIGGVVHYRDPQTRLDFGYNSHIGNPVLLGTRKLFDGKTRLLLSANEDYTGSFLGYERPHYGAMISDTRKLAQFGKFRVDSYESAGYFKDEFFPNNNKNFFVQPKSSDAKPVYAGRVQLQAQLRSTEPLLRVGKVLDFGLQGDIALSGYSTGDMIGLIRGGPTMSLHLGDRFYSTGRYYYAATAGDTPFVFDSYYRGRQNLVWSNQVKINNYLSLGLRSDMNLTRDNSQNALLTGNAVYMLVGPKEFKLNLAYDVVRKRSYFGLHFYPGSESRGVEYDKMRIFQPENYSNPVVPD